MDTLHGPVARMIAQLSLTLVLVCGIPATITAERDGLRDTLPIATYWLYAGKFGYQVEGPAKSEDFHESVKLQMQREGLAIDVSSRPCVAS